MSRLTVIIFALAFVILGYAVYLSQLALEENRENSARLQTLAAKLAQTSPPPVTGPFVQQAAPVSDPLVAQVALQKMQAVDQLLMLSKIAEPSKYRTALALANRARQDLGAPGAAPVNADRLYAALLYLSEAERLLGVMENSEAAPKRQSSLKIYHMAPGETLWEISAKLYKTPWHWDDILKANSGRIANYKKIPSGFLLNLPTPGKNWGACAVKKS